MSNPNYMKEVSHESVQSRDNMDRLPQYALEKKIPFDRISPSLTDSARLLVIVRLIKLPPMRSFPF
jgi:hypothetical protein